MAEEKIEETVRRCPNCGRCQLRHAHWHRFTTWEGILAALLLALWITLLLTPALWRQPIWVAVPVGLTPYTLAWWLVDRGIKRAG